jgi:hypothetical protein
MFDNIKWYLVNLGIKKYVPMGIMAAVAALGTFMAAHAGMLEQYGVTYGLWPLIWPAGQDPSGPCILIELDTLSTATITAVAGLAAILIRVAQHHTTGTTVPPAVEPPKEA